MLRFITLITIFILASACAPNTPAAPTTAPANASTPTSETRPTAAPTSTLVPSATNTTAPTVAPSATSTTAPTAAPSATTTNTALPPASTPTIAARPTQSAARSALLTIKGFLFKPEVLSVPVGTSVTWTNMDDIEHSVTSGTPPTPDGKFDSGFFTLGKSYSFTFTQPGDYTYFCKRHKSMTATVRVTAQ